MSKEWANASNILKWLPNAMYRRKRLLDRTNHVARGIGYDTALHDCPSCENKGERLVNSGGKYIKIPCPDCRKVGGRYKTFKDWSDALVQYHTPNVRLVKLDKSDPSGESYDEIGRVEHQKVIDRLKTIAGGGKVNIREKLRDMDAALKEAIEGSGMEEQAGLKEGAYENPSRAKTFEHRIMSLLNMGTIKNKDDKIVPSYKPRSNKMFIPTVNSGTFSRSNRRDSDWSKATYNGFGDIEKYAKSINKLLIGSGAHSSGLTDLLRILDADKLSDLGHMVQYQDGAVGWENSDFLNRETRVMMAKKTTLDKKKRDGVLSKHDEMKYDDIEYFLTMAGHNAWHYREETDEQGDTHQVASGHPLALMAEMAHDNDGASYRLVPIDHHGWAKRDVQRSIQEGAYCTKSTSDGIKETSQQMAQRTLSPTGILGDINSGIKQLGLFNHAFGGTVYAGEMDRILNLVDGLDEHSKTLKQDSIFTPGSLWMDMVEAKQQIKRLTERLAHTWTLAEDEMRPELEANLADAHARYDAYNTHYHREMEGDPNIPNSGVKNSAGGMVTLPDIDKLEDINPGGWQVHRPQILEHPHDALGPVQEPATAQLMNHSHVMQPWRIDEDPESDTYNQRLSYDKEGNEYPLHLKSEEYGEDGEKKDLKDRTILTPEELRGLTAGGQALFQRTGGRTEGVEGWLSHEQSIHPLHEPGSDKVKIMSGGKEYHYPVIRTPPRERPRPGPAQYRPQTDEELPEGYMEPPPPDTTSDQAEGMGYNVKTPDNKSEDPIDQAWSNILKNIKIVQ